MAFRIFNPPFPLHQPEEADQGFFFFKKKRKEGRKEGRKTIKKNLFCSATPPIADPILIGRDQSRILPPCSRSDLRYSLIVGRLKVFSLPVPVRWDSLNPLPYVKDRSIITHFERNRTPGLPLSAQEVIGFLTC